jgi:hypothetical protein
MLPLAIDIRDSVFYNIRGGGFEVLLYSGGFPTSINATTQNSSVSFFPNPVSANEVGNGIQLFLPEQMTDAEIVIQNSNRCIILRHQHLELEKGINTIPMNAGFLPGVYLLTMSTRGQSITGKLMIE